MVDGNPEVVVDRANESIRILAVECRVDSCLACRAGNVHPQVTRERQYGDVVDGGIDAQHHDGVGSLAERLTIANSAGRSISLVGAGTIVGPGEEEVPCPQRTGVVVPTLDRSAVGCGW